MKTQFTDFGTLVRLRDPADASRKNRCNSRNLPKTENKETETQKTNSIPFAKPIRRPKLILMIGISILPIFESFVCESQIKTLRCCTQTTECATPSKIGELGDNSCVLEKQTSTNN